MGKSIITEIALLSPHERALQEAGKKLFIDSVEVGRTFCSFMISTSVSSIPIYMAIVAYLHSGEKGFSKFGYFDKVMVISPCFIFIISMVIFILGYLPNMAQLNLDYPEFIESSLDNIIKKRRKFIIAGVIFFTVAITNSIISFIFLLNKTF